MSLQDPESRNQESANLPTRAPSTSRGTASAGPSKQTKGAARRSAGVASVETNGANSHGAPTTCQDVGHEDRKHVTEAGMSTSQVLAFRPRAGSSSHWMGRKGPKSGLECLSRGLNYLPQDTLLRLFTICVRTRLISRVSFVSC